jgi:hypothetical protein
MFSKRWLLTLSSFVVTTFVYDDVLLRIITPTIPDTSKKQGEGQAEYFREVFYNGNVGWY